MDHTNNANVRERSYKVVFMGNGGTGKTTMVKRMLTGEFERKYLPTVGVEVHPLKYNTNHGRIILNVWDTAGQEQFGGLRDGYYLQGDAGVIFTCTNAPRTSVREAVEYSKDFHRICPEAPMFIWNNIIAGCSPVEPDIFAPLDEFPQYDVNAKNAFYEDAVVNLLKALTGE